MNEFTFYYLLVISVSGFVLLLMFGIMSFFNLEAFKLKKGTSLKSAISLIISACLYLGIVIFLIIYKKRNENIERENNQHEVLPINSFENSNISN